MLSLKLALRNLQKSKSSFLPFLIASVTMFVMLFVVTAMSISPTVSKLPGGDAVSQLLIFAMIILAIFSGIILIYSYRFLQLQRSKEFGLYDILGFGKGRIMSVSSLELLFSFLMTVAIGSLVGVALSKVLFLIFVRMIGGKYFDLVLSPQAFGIVIFVFAVIFLLLLIQGAFIIWKSSSLDLLREESKGEREPRSNGFVAFLGLAFLIAGYVIALRVSNPIQALLNFFLAVLLVILGTYFFYISFTIWYLKWRKKRDSYYKPHNFITISSMLYRMKQNAAGLANITILLTMTLVTVVVTSGIFIGTSQYVNQSFPKEAKIVSYDSSVRANQLEDQVNTAAKQAGITSISHLTAVRPVTDVLLNGQIENNVITISPKAQIGSLSSAWTLDFITQSDLKKLGNAVPNLQAHQVAVYGFTLNTQSSQRLEWGDKKFEIKTQLDSVNNFPRPNAEKSLLIVVADESVLDSMQKSVQLDEKMKESGLQSFHPMVQAFFDISKNDQDKLQAQFNKLPTSNVGISFRSQAVGQANSFIGSFLFIGFVLGISFILGAALIIYYKQISEGQQDKRSYRILQEIGLSKEQVNKTIKSQVKMIFFMPIIVTVIHFTFAYRMISELIKLFGIIDNGLILVISFISILVLSLMYYLIYRITSKIYSKIVER